MTNEPTKLTEQELEEQELATRSERLEQEILQVQSDQYSIRGYLTAKASLNELNTKEAKKAKKQLNQSYKIIQLLDAYNTKYHKGRI